MSAKVLMRVISAGFVVGAAMEFFMIKVHFGESNFYETAKRKAAERRDEIIRERNAARARKIRDQFGHGSNSGGGSE